MLRIVAGVVLLLGLRSISFAWQAPEGLFDRFLERMEGEQKRLPDYVCSQTIERFGRAAAHRELQRIDIVRLDVAVTGDRELYGRPGARQFYGKSLAEVIGSGFVSTGRFALFTRQILNTSKTMYKYQGLNERPGKPAHEYDFDVDPASSNYVLRSGNAEAKTGYQGSFWIHADSLDLLRVEVQAFDIPEHLGLSEAKTTLIYGRMSIGQESILLPVLTTATVITTDGLENVNRIQVQGCRRFQSESTLSFDAPAEASPKPHETFTLPSGAVLELALDEGLNLSSATVGQPLRASLARDLRLGERLLAPQGTVVRGQVVQVEKRAIPYPTYQIGLTFDALELGGESVPLNVTLAETSPVAGLIQQSRKLNPAFQAGGKPRMQLLVRKVQTGEGYLEWDARKGQILPGLKMKWRVTGDK
ncbi:hypothetical protein [Paludibaculum fermentans]|uniref:Uncharacterized protein n=1 Tax=Paludibaculum fermentans TaxID=1473598 RepID=A0A7S7NRT2_PALFE|nr:hypothetical protein [Paludibaculum fermentans]QOY88617.1 hypothetical protein IRI77_01255 [Paludibaculum fermentans]